MGTDKAFDDFDQLASSGYLFRIADNRGETADRYTVLFSDGDALGMNESGIGFSQFVGQVDPAHVYEMIRSGEWDDIAPADLTEGTRDHILRRINEVFADFIEHMSGPDVPASRDEVDELNDGTYQSGGNGIWRDDEGFHVALDEGDDRGPFATPGEALRASLPDEHSLAGPEYHSAHLPTSPAEAAPESGPA